MKMYFILNFSFFLLKIVFLKNNFFKKNFKQNACVSCAHIMPAPKIDKFISIAVDFTDHSGTWFVFFLKKNQLLFFKTFFKN